MKNGIWKREIHVTGENCCGCQACQDVCPVQAIHMRQDPEGFWYPVTDGQRCTGCGACQTVCPMEHADRKKGKRLYAGVQANNEKIRFSSSSGGMFSILADYVLERRGVVYGAGFDRQMQVAHMGVCHAADLENLRKTKYVQSNMNGIYREVQNYLSRGRWVLFCGTPCQVRAMRLFLGENIPRLILADLVCYGASSPGMWKDYVTCLENRGRGKLEKFVFRDKRNRDAARSYSYVINGKEKTGVLWTNSYCQLYFGNYLLRPSCHVCPFCTVERDSDFTLGDFWGIEKVNPLWDDGMGTSLVMIHTEKAEEIWRSVRGHVRWFPCEKEDILQPRLMEPTRPAKWRDFFMKAYRILPFWNLMEIINRRKKQL